MLGRNYSIVFESFKKSILRSFEQAANGSSFFCIGECVCGRVGGRGREDEKLNSDTTECIWETTPERRKNCSNEGKI